jgi:uridine kinase
MSTTLVIAFSGTAGAGKTSLIRALAGSGLDCAPLFSDSYHGVALWLPPYTARGLQGEEAGDAWFAEGCPVDGYTSVPRLVEDLAALKRGVPIVTPAPAPDGGGEQHIQPARYILLEDTWSQRAELRELVDYRVHLRLPLDISLARRLLRDHGQGANLAAILTQYLKVGAAYSRRVDALGDGADLVLDGTRPPDELLKLASDWIRAL